MHAIKKQKQIRQYSTIFSKDRVGADIAAEKKTRSCLIILDLLSISLQLFSLLQLNARIEIERLVFLLQDKSYTLKDKSSTLLQDKSYALKDKSSTLLQDKSYALKDQSFVVRPVIHYLFNQLHNNWTMQPTTRHSHKPTSASASGKDNNKQSSSLGKSQGSQKASAPKKPEKQPPQKRKLQAPGGSQLKKKSGGSLRKKNATPSNKTVAPALAPIPLPTISMGVSQPNPVCLAVMRHVARRFGAEMVFDCCSQVLGELAMSRQPTYPAAPANCLPTALSPSSCHCSWLRDWYYGYSHHQGSAGVPDGR